jgi:hypothetical protein
MADVPAQEASAVTGNWQVWQADLRVMHWTPG